MTGAIYSFQHDQRFPTVEYLADYLERTLRKNGKYRVVTAKNYARLEPGDIVLFHKKRKFVGKAIIKQGLRERHEKEFQGYVTFEPNSVCVYDSPIPFEDVEVVLGKRLGHRRPSKIGRVAYRFIARRRCH
jgi:hypothetical protein